MTDPAQPRFVPSAPTSPGSILRSEFFRLTPANQQRALRQGWRVVDDPPGSRPAPTISRAQFDAMPLAGQQMFLERGGRVSE